jgi:hypothetical protein
MTDDDTLDLSAWEPPAPPPGFVDDVVACTRGAATVGATALAFDDETRATPPWRRTAAIAAASAAAGALVALVVSARDRDDARPASVASRDDRVADSARPMRATQPTPSPSPSPTPTPTPIPSPAIAPDGLTTADIDRVIRTHASAVRECYRRGLASKPDLGGKLVVAFDIDGDGRVHDPAVSSQTGVWDAGVPACIVHVVAQLAFPAKGGSTRVVFPFVLATELATAPTRVLIDRPIDEPSIEPGADRATSAVPPEQPVDCDPTHYMHGMPADCRKGWLRVDSQPAARIYIDGVDTGVTTPGALAVPIGRHKVTFVVGDDRYTYPVTIRGGQTETIMKSID